MSTINTIHTITSPNITMNVLPPKTIAVTTIVINTRNMNNKIVNNTILYTSLNVSIKGYVYDAK